MASILLANRWKVIWKSMVSYCFLVLLSFVRVVMLPAYRVVSNDTRLEMDGYLLWLLVVAQSCYSFWECFPCCSLVCYSVLMLVGRITVSC